MVSRSEIWYWKLLLRLALNIRFPVPTTPQKKTFCIDTLEVHIDHSFVIYIFFSCMRTFIGYGKLKWSLKTSMKEWSFFGEITKETVNAIILIKKQTDPHVIAMNKKFTKIVFHFNRLTFARTRGGGGGVRGGRVLPPPWGFFVFFFS